MRIFFARPRRSALCCLSSACSMVGHPDPFSGTCSSAARSVPETSLKECLLVSLGCRTCPAGLGLGVCPLQNKGLLFLGPLLVLTRLSGLSSSRRKPAMTSSCSVCPSSMTCKRLGCCCFFVALPAATTFSGGFPRRSRPSTPVLMAWLFCRLSRACLVSTVLPTRLERSPSCPCRSVALVCCLLLQLLSQRFGHLGQIVCRSFVNSSRMRRRLSSVTLTPRSRKRPLRAAATAHAELSLADCSSVTARRRRPRKRTGPRPLFADGRRLRPPPLPAARARSCSPFWTHPAWLCSSHSKAPSPAAFSPLCPPCPALDYPSQLFHVLLLRRLCLPLPLSPFGTPLAATVQRVPGRASLGAAAVLPRRERRCVSAGRLVPESHATRGLLTSTSTSNG